MLEEKFVLLSRATEPILWESSHLFYRRNEIERIGHNMECPAMPNKKYNLNE